MPAPVVHQSRWPTASSTTCRVRALTWFLGFSLAAIATQNIQAASDQDTAQVYKWTDQTGIVHYSDEPPEAKGNRRLQRLTLPPTNRLKRIKINQSPEASGVKDSPSRVLKRKPVAVLIGNTRQEAVNNRSQQVITPAYFPAPYPVRSICQTRWRHHSPVCYRPPVVKATTKRPLYDHDHHSSLKGYPSKTMGVLKNETLRLFNH